MIYRLLPLIIFALGIEATALPQLTCTGNLPAWVIRGSRAIRLNIDEGKFIVDPRQDPVILFGVRADRAWVKLTLSEHLTWTDHRENYRSFVTLAIKSDSESYFAVRVEGIFVRLGQSLVCDVDDDMRAAGSR